MAEVVTREERFASMFRRHYGHVTAYARRRVPEDVVEDVVAEVFLTAWRHLDRLPDLPLPWLYGVARHAVSNQRRGDLRLFRLRSRLWGLGAGRGSGADQGDQTERVVETDRVLTAMTQLTPRDREVLRLIAWEDLSIHDAAIVMGVSETAMKVRVHRARRRLGVLLAGEQQGTPPAGDGDPGALNAPIDQAGDHSSLGSWGLFGTQPFVAEVTE
jgi:RNA polymerase sigma-70 factor, ECF subfamily